MLTFTLYYLCKNPEAMRKATEEVDEILGDEPIRLEHIGKLKYISGAHLRLCTPCASAPLLLRDSLTLCPTACLRESLRLTPPATIRMVESVEDTTVCGGKYAIPKGARIGIVASKCQTDPKVWGEDVRRSESSMRVLITEPSVGQAREFKPERVYGENFEKLPVSRLISHQLRQQI